MTAIFELHLPSETLAADDLLYWLDGLAQDNELETALLFATLKSMLKRLDR